MSHTQELAELDRKIADLDEQYQAGSLPAKAYARMMTRLEARRDELAALPQREARVMYEHDADSPTVRDHWASLTTEDRGAFLRGWGVQIFADRQGYVVVLGWDDPDGTGSLTSSLVVTGQEDFPTSGRSTAVCAALSATQAVRRR